MPDNWNGMFIVYTHGYVDPNQPLSLPNDFIGTIPVKQFIVQQGFGYAASSYSQNGFAVKEAITDVIFLGNILKAHFKPQRIFLGGVSEGALIALKTLERNQKIFDAGLVACGPIGDFQRQIQYFGNFHVIFKALYKDALEGAGIDIGSPEHVPETTMQLWSSGALDLPLAGIVVAEKSKLQILFQAAQIPSFPPFPVPTLTDSLQVVKDILRFNIMATNDLAERVHGVPFDNTMITYPTSIIDDVIIIEGDKQAFKRIESLYETYGNPSVPIVFIHTMGDHVTPVWHLNTYLSQKVDVNRIGVDLFYFIVPVAGHCTFDISYVEQGIGAMISLTN